MSLEQHSSEQAAAPALSYKFQRLREKLRQAIASGELSGKLPGERVLAKRFHVNAKTLSKALTDLAAEGLLDRSVGRGTYVKGHAPAGVAAKRWLVVCDAEQVESDLVHALRAAHPELEVITEVSSLRPSFLNQFSALLDLSADTPEAFVRRLVVRNIPVVAVCKEPRIYSTHAVLFDDHLAILQLGRDLLLGGHRRLAAVEPRGGTAVVNALSKAVARYAPQAQIDGCFATECASIIDSGVTAIVCQSVTLAQAVKQQLEQRGVAVPAQMSLAAVGCTSTDHGVSGYFLPHSEQARVIVDLLSDVQIRPTTLWLAGQYVDRGTIAPLAGPAGEPDLRYNIAPV